MKIVCVLGAIALASQVAATAGYESPRRVSGAVPQPPVNALGWVEAVFDVEIDSSGAITTTTGLRATPDGVDRILPSIKNWRFRPAKFDGKPVSSHVLVAAMMRPAQLFDPAGGQPAQTLKEPSADVPVPMNFTRPPYPARTVGNRSVLVEVLIREDGRVEAASIVGSPSGFDDAALTTAKSWSFRPARYEGKPVKGVAYVVFGFRMPV